MTAFADVTVGKEWNDSLTGTSANNRALPTVSLSGETSYEKLLNLMYPVGSYYMSADENFDPNTAWGGTWELLPEAQTVIQAGSTYTFGSTGGEATHKLTIAEMPSHSHTLGYRTNTSITTGSTGQWTVDPGTVTAWSSVGAAVGYTGGGGAHNNMPPYVAGNIWKRTA